MKTELNNSLHSNRSLSQELPGTNDMAKHIVNLSGGKDSTAMLLMMLKRNMRIDEIHYADVGEMAEFQEMYTYIDKVESHTGRHVMRLKSNIHTARSIFYGYPTRGKHMDEIRGFPQTIGPGCRYRSWLKSDVLDSANGNGNFIYIGIAADEAHRAGRNEYARSGNHFCFPLIEWGVTENMCLQYTADQGLSNSLYRYFRRLGCWWCPKQSLKSLKNLYLHFPCLWNDLKALEKDQGRPYKYGYTVDRLEAKFKTESEE
jgi:3'-phosphoadenosine 5'-phosphosulfate sulfotransferase (PAPS reductase)/FAD synthetase